MYSYRLLATLAFTILAYIAVGQRGLIIQPATSSVMDPNGDGYVSKTTDGFSNKGYYVDEFEIEMFGLPVFGDGDTLNDTQAGPNCGTTDLTVDSTGVSAYAALDASNNLIFRLRLADEHPSVEAYTILIDTDGAIGSADPNSTGNNAGFEIDITLIKNNSQGVNVYDIDGIDSCPTPVLQYPIADNFQVAIADEVSCGDEDYFYDFFLPFDDLTAEFGITLDSELQFVVLTNISGTCAMAGKISDIGGVDDNEYGGCITCAFDDLASNQCPVPFSSILEGGEGFLSGATPTPTMELPLKQGDAVITGTAEPTAELILDIYDLNDTFLGTETATANSDSIWTINLGTALAQGDSVTAVAQLEGVCDSGITGSQISFAVVVLNTTPQINGTGTTLNYTENDGEVPVDPGILATDNEDLDLVSATIQIITGYEPTEDALTFTDQLGITGAYDAGTATLTLTGDVSIDDYNTALQNVNYVNSSEDPIESTRTIEFTINDGTEDSPPFTRNISVSKVNDPPVLDGTSGSTEYTTETPPFVVNATFSITDLDDTQLTAATVRIVASATDVSVDGDDLFFTNMLGITGIYDGATGVMSLSGSASLSDYATAINSIEYEYNPPGSANENTRKITFSASDGTDDSNLVDHFVTFATSINFPPDVVDENGFPIVDGIDVVTNEDATVEVCLTVNDPDGDLVSIDNITAPVNGSILETSELCFEYTPNANYNGTETVTVTVCDGFGNCDSTPVDIDIVVDEVNDAPVLAPSTATVDEKITTQLCIDPADITDIEGDVHVFSAGSSTNGGTVDDGTAGDLCFDYTPPSGFVGNDQIEVTICDSDDPTVCATNTIDIDVISVNENPIIFVDGIESSTMTVEMVEDVTNTFCFAVVDVDGDNVSTTSITKISGNGTLVEDATEFCYEYTPSANDNGTSVWEIMIQDDATIPLTDMVTVTLNIVAVNDLPTLDVIADPAAIDEDASEQTINLSGISAGGGETQTLMVTATSDNTSLIADPTVIYTNADDVGSLVYTPLTDQFGTATITVSVDDGGTENNMVQQSFTIVVNGINDPPAITSTTLTVDEKVTSSVCIDVVDVENDTHQFTMGTSLVANAIITNEQAGDLCFEYTPPTDFTGSDQVEITICDVGDGTICTTETINVEVTDINDSPIILVNGLEVSNISLSGTEDTPLDFCLEFNDPENHNVFTSSLSNLEGGGGLAEGGSALCYTYTPEENVNGLVVWEVEICDDGSPSMCSTVFVEIDLASVNDVPIAQVDTLHVLRRVPGSINVLLNDSDIDGDDLFLENLVESPTGGTVEISGDGTITYTSEATFRGIDQLTYSIVDSGSPVQATTGQLVIVVGDNPFTIYQTISPNGDGINDYWHIEGIDFYPTNEVKLFDRFNNLVFQMDGYDNRDKRWNGRGNQSSSGILEDGTYYYQVLAGDAGEFTGFVVLRTE